MFNIAILSNDHNISKKYIESLKEMKLTVEVVSKETNIDSYFDKKKIDAFIIEETGKDDFIQTCEIIMDIRRAGNNFIWVMTKDEIKKQKKFYFDLGVDGIAANSHEQELAASQIKNILSHSKGHQEIKAEQLKSQQQNVVFLPENQSIIVGSGDQIALTRLEYRVVSVLKENSGTAMSPAQIYQFVWDELPKEEKVVTYRVSNIIFHLRKKLKKDSKFLKTVRSKGYMFVE